MIFKDDVIAIRDETGEVKYYLTTAKCTTCKAMTICTGKGQEAKNNVLKWKYKHKQTCGQRRKL